MVIKYENPKKNHKILKIKKIIKIKPTKMIKIKPKKNPMFPRFVIACSFFCFIFYILYFVV